MRQAFILGAGVAAKLAAVLAGPEVGTNPPYQPCARRRALWV
jgi:hypothetical protein